MKVNQNEYSNYYDQSELWSRSLSDNEIERISITLSLIPEDVKTILDIGSGDGRITNVLISRYSVVAMDISREALKRIKTRKTLANIEQTPFKDRTFDLVLSTEVIEHLPNPVLHKAVEEFQRLSKKYILLTVPYKENLYKGSTKCNDCGKLFHLTLHFQSFTRERLFSIFDDFTPVRYTTFGQEDYNNGLLLFIIRQFGNKWSTTETALCPHCGSRNVGGGEGNIFSWVAERINWRMAEAYPFRGKRWIAVLYEKNGIF